MEEHKKTEVIFNLLLNLNLVDSISIGFSLGLVLLGEVSSLVQRNRIAAFFPRVNLKFEQGKVKATIRINPVAQKCSGYLSVPPGPPLETLTEL